MLPRFVSRSFRDSFRYQKTFPLALYVKSIYTLLILGPAQPPDDGLKRSFIIVVSAVLAAAHIVIVNGN